MKTLGTTNSQDSVGLI